MASSSIAPDALSQKGHQSIQRDLERREPDALAYLTLFSATALGAGMCAIDYQVFGFGFQSLFPALRNGSSGIDGEGVLCFASVTALLGCEVLLAKASEHWSDQTRRRMNLASTIATGIFVCSAVSLIPLSIWQANDQTQSGDGLISQIAYLAFSAVLACLPPLSVLSMHALIAWAKPALARVARNLPIDRRIRDTRRVLQRREATQAELRKIKQHQAHALTDAKIAEQSAAESAAVVEQVAGHLSRTILARKIGGGSADKPLVASDYPLWNHADIAELESLLGRLEAITPAAIKRRLLEEETV